MTRVQIPPGPLDLFLFQKKERYDMDEGEQRSRPHCAVLHGLSPRGHELTVCSGLGTNIRSPHALQMAELSCPVLEELMVPHFPHVHTAMASLSFVLYLSARRSTMDRRLCAGRQFAARWRQGFSLRRAVGPVAQPGTLMRAAQARADAGKSTRLLVSAKSALSA